MRKLMAMLFCLVLVKAAFTQEGGRRQNMGLVIGNVLDSSTGKALSEITVSMKALGGGTVIKTVLTDKNGGFELDKLPFGLYTLRFSAVNYGSLSIDSINIREERFDFDMGDIKLRIKTGDMDEVVVYAEKPLLESKDGKITFNVGESALSSGSSTTELLNSMPLISNDADGKILLKGKEPRILIDNKPTELNAQQLSDLLESLPGSSVEKIELMTNPDPEYASESGGVINIITRKGKVGLTGRINLSYGTRGEGKLTTNIAYRNQKISLNINGGLGASRLKGGGYSNRTNNYKDSTNFLYTENAFVNKNLRPNLRASLDYEINKEKTFNVTAEVNGNYFDNESTTEYTNINRFEQPWRISSRLTGANGQSLTPALSASYQYKGKTTKEVLRLIAQYNYSNGDNTRDYFQQYMNGDRQPTGVDSAQKQVTDQTSSTLAFRGSYDKPIKWLKSTLSFGASLNQKGFHNELVTSFLKKPERVLVQNPLLSNDFVFPQTIATARAGINVELKPKLRLITSLQAEQTVFKFRFKSDDIKETNDYLNLLPTVTLRKYWVNDYEASFTYRKTIRRPGVNELNPSINYSDPYNLRFGNTSLLPQLANNYDLSFGKTKGKFYINASLGYNHLTDIIQSIRTLQDDGKTNTTYLNVTDREEYEATMFGGYTFSRMLRLNASAGYTYNEYSLYDRTHNKYRNGGSFYTSINYSIIVSDRLSFDGVLKYNVVSSAQGRSRSNLSQNLGMQAKFLNKRLIFTVNLADLFAQQRYTTFTTGSNFTLENVSNTNTKNIRLGIAYNLKKNRTKVSSKQSKQLIKKLNTK